MKFKFDKFVKDIVKREVMNEKSNREKVHEKEMNNFFQIVKNNYINFGNKGFWGFGAKLCKI